jgi:2-polyprenyl-3-methyl-5-hydroxy-6-metoxy-1,4-benzoquinol methylase
MENNTTLPCCPICENQTIHKFSVPCDYRKPNNPKDYKIYWCLECSYGFLWERPSKTEIADFYVLDDYYTHNTTNTKTNEADASFLDQLRTHISWRIDFGEELTPRDATSLLNKKDLNICEIGCGNGDNLSKFLADGFSVFGVEPDPVAREVANKAVGNVFEGTAEELPETIKNRKYDVVLMSHVLEHCLDINTTISNVKKILNHGGIYIIETPNCQSHGFRSLNGEWRWSDIPRHLNFFTPSSLKMILTKHNFNVESVKYRGFCRQFSNNWLQEEEKIWQAFSQYNSIKNVRPNFSSRAWKLLFKSFFSSKASKYDSVRVIGINA